ncbi:MAG: RluA family pseudouridine synthase [Leptonema sp. (in: bacteria)]
MILQKKEILVHLEEKNLRLDKFLSKRFNSISRQIWQRRIQKGIVQVNDKITKKSYLVKYNDKISFYYPKKSEPEIQTNFRIIYEDEYLIGIDKPPHLPIHPSGNYKKNTLNYLIKEYYKNTQENFYCHPIHRIDKETSGIVLYGKSPSFINKMNQMFQNNQIHKKYYVLVFGKIEKEKVLEGYIGKDFFSKIKRKQRFIPKEKIKDFLNEFKGIHKSPDFVEIFFQNTYYKYRYCKTSFIPKKIKQISHFKYQFITLLEVEIFTGRLHQIRASLNSLKFPVVGDKIYGIDENYFLSYLEDPKDFSKELLLNRTALHSYSLNFVHPISKRELTLVSPLPEDIQNRIEF